MSKTIIQFDATKEEFVKGFYKIEYYDSMGYSSGIVKIFVKSNELVFYDDGADTFIYEKPFDKCNTKDVNYFVDKCLDYTMAYEMKYESYYRYGEKDDYGFEYTNDWDIDLDETAIGIKPLKQPKKQKQITIKTLTESEINGMTYPRYLASCILATSDLENEEYYEEEDRITRILTNEFKNINKTI